jgi:imidazoleglycerol-phosphate dehydratase
MATVSRTTGETDVQVSLNLDGTGACTAATGIPFLDHMLHQISSHGLIDLEVRAKGTLKLMTTTQMKMWGLRWGWR